MGLLTSALEASLIEIVGQVLDEIGQSAKGTDVISPRSRYLGLREDSQSILVDIDSTNWRLAEKTTFEHIFYEALNLLDSEFPSKVVVYFKKNKKPLTMDLADASSGPAPLKRKQAPYGLMIEHKKIPGVHRVVVVASGKGGVGKSTVSVNLALALKGLDQRVGILDADLHGPSLPLMLGLSGPHQVGDHQKLKPHEKHGVKAASIGFMAGDGEPILWRGPVLAKAMKQLCYDVAWGELDYLVVDLPPGTGDVQMTLIESLPIDQAVIVSTPQDLALIDAKRAVGMFGKLNVPVLGVIENMSFHLCSNCGHSSHPFGTGGAEQYANQQKIPFLGRLPISMKIREAGDSGKPIVLEGRDHSLAESFFKIAEELTLRL
jgi:ATP-binding protein involved in chromosome partitioning